MTTPVRPGVAYSGLYEAPLVGPDGRITEVWYDALFGLTSRANTSGDLSASDLHAGAGIVIATILGVPPSVTISATGVAGGTSVLGPTRARAEDSTRVYLITSGVASGTGITALTGDVTASGSGSVVATIAKASVLSKPIVFAADGGGSAIATGIFADVYIPYACTITANTLLADQAGSLVIDLWMTTAYSSVPTVVNTITASDLPTLSSAAQSQDTTLTGWTTSVTAGSRIRATVNSASTVTRFNLTLTTVAA